MSVARRLILSFRSSSSLLLATTTGEEFLLATVVIIPTRTGVNFIDRQGQGLTNPRADSFRQQS